MRRFYTIPLAAFVLALAACGGRATVASRSAAAYREAVAKAIPIDGGGHVHGGHMHEAAPSTDQSMPGMNMPESVTTAGSHAGRGGSAMNEMTGMTEMKNGTPTGVTRSMHGMSGGKDSAMAGMDHSSTQHGSMSAIQGMHGAMDSMSESSTKRGSMKNTQNMPGMSQSKSGMSMGSTGGTQNGAATSMGGMTGMQHGGPPAPSAVIPAPLTSAGMAQLNPASILQQDPVDRPSKEAGSQPAMRNMPGMQTPQHRHGGNEEP